MVAFVVEVEAELWWVTEVVEKRLAKDFCSIGPDEEVAVVASVSVCVGVVLRKSTWSSMTTYGISAAAGLTLVIDSEISAWSFGAATGVKCAV